MTRPIALLLLAGVSAFGACIPLAGDRILGRDLALANPSFAPLPATVTIGYAPAPGTRRIFSVAELGRIARANLIEPAGLTEVCFEIPTQPINAAAAREAMLHVLPDGAELEIVELPKTNVPAGRLEFPLTGLEPAAKGSRLWRGSVWYGETLRMPVWARVSVMRKHLAVVAGRNLPPNVPIDREALRLESVAVPLDSERVAECMEDVLGRVPKKLVSAGQPIPLAILDLPPLVHRGDAIKVEVRSGTARLLFDAVAQNTARKGDMVDLRNPDSGQTFRARVEDSGRALVVVPSRETL